MTEFFQPSPDDIRQAWQQAAEEHLVEIAIFDSHFRAADKTGSPEVAETHVKRGLDAVGVVFRAFRQNLRMAERFARLEKLFPLR